MNKKIAVVLAVMMVLLSLTSCGKNKQETEQTGTTHETTEANQPEIKETEQKETVSTQQETESEEMAAKPENRETAVENPFDSKTEVSEENTQEETAENTTPDETAGGNTSDSGNVVRPLTEYEKYQNMSGAEQKAFMESFGSMEAFFAWLNNAREEYEASIKSIEAGNGTLNLEEIMK